MNKLVIGAVLAGSAVVASTAHAQTEIRLAHVLQPSAQAHIVAEEVAERVAERTEGRVQITVFPSAQLGTTTEIIEQATFGEPVIGYGDAAYLSTFGVPELAILGGPFIIANNEEGQRLAASDLVQGWFDQLAEESGLRVLALNWFDGARHIIGQDGYPMPSDLEGVLMRIPPIPTWQNTFEPLGAVPVTVEAQEVYSALSQGVVEAAESPLVGMANFNWQEVADTVTLTGHFNLFLGWTMSEEVFQSLSEEDQEIMLEEFQAGGRELTERNAAIVGETRADFEAAGVEFVQPDLDAYREATRAFFEFYPEWPDDLIDQVRQAAAE
jgi:TRAP-type C4-dicarboxylate transport system substrate-binding protein